MALITNDHIHIDTANPPIVTYGMEHGTFDHSQQVAVAYERGITGKLHVHRLESSTGVPVKFDADKGTLFCTLVEMNTIRGLAGQQVYYVEPYHDDDDMGTWPTSAYIVRGILMVNPGAVTNLDPMCSLWSVQVEIADTDKVV